MEKQRLVEVIAEGRIRNLSDEEIAQMILDTLEVNKREKKPSTPQRQQPPAVDTVGD